MVALSFEGMVTGIRAMTFQLVGDGPRIYEEVMVPLWFGRWAEALIDQLSLRNAERVLDVACGTGVTTRLTRARIGPDGSVAGLDVNAPMLAQAKELAGDLDIAWIASDVCDSGLPSESYDVILSQHGYHYFPDKPQALREFLRLLAPGGRLGFSIWDGHSPYTSAICAAVAHHISPEIARKQRSQRETPSAKELRDQMSAQGFSNVGVVRQELMIDVPLAPEFVPLHLRSMPIADAFTELTEDAQNALIDEVAEALTDYVQGDRLVYPDAVHVAIGFK